jgi:hypothetical protein
VAAALFLSRSLGAHAQDAATEVLQAQGQQQPPPPDSGWSFSVSPYLWLAGLSGDVGVSKHLPTVDVDVGFDDIFDKIDWFPPPVMLVGEARYQRYSAFTDFIYLGLDAGNSATKGSLSVDADVEMHLAVWTFGGAYRLIDDGRMSLGVLAGGRLWNVHGDLKVESGAADRSRDATQTWVDPIIGLNGRVDLGEGFAIQAEGDVGGFGAAADIDWQLLGTLQYQVSDWARLEAGYRYLAVDYDSDGFVLDAAIHGPIIGATLRF